MTAETNNARDWVLVPRNPTEAMIDAWRDAPDIWEDAYAAMLAAAPPPADAQQGQAVAECHCATCTCAPGMTPAVRFDTSPAAQEGAVREHLIALGWTPPNTAPPPSAPVGVEWPLSLLRAEHWREVYIGHRCMRLEVTYDYATWERLMAEIESALAQQPAAPTLAKHQPCGCVICTCEDERQCQGCGAKHCGNRADHPPYVVQQPAAVDEAMLRKLRDYFEGINNDEDGDDYRNLSADAMDLIDSALATQHQEPKS